MYSIESLFTAVAKFYSCHDLVSTVLLAISLAVASRYHSQRLDFVSKSSS